MVRSKNMRKYLTELHKKSDRHKKRFAFLASGTITLFIFGVWSLAVFSPKADQPLSGGENNRLSVSEVSPFQSIRMNLAASLEAIGDSFGELKAGLETMDFEAEYREMRDGALDTYGQ